MGDPDASRRAVEARVLRLGALAAKKNRQREVKQRILLSIAVAGVAAAGIFVFVLSAKSQPSEKPSLHFPGDKPIPKQITCKNNLRMIAIAMRMWAYDHEFKYPFQVSTNKGGTMELSEIGPDGLDTNSFRHFQILTNQEQLTTPSLLVCPQDHSKRPAVSVEDVNVTNVTYRLRITTNVNLDHPRETLVVCPVDGNAVTCDGTIVEPLKK
jgi:hypothetical protein